MDFPDKTREELISVLQEIINENNYLKVLKEKRTDELTMANREPACQNEEKEKRVRLPNIIKKEK